MTLDNNKAHELFNAARNLPSAEREPFLDKECGEDDALRVEVETLLSHIFTSANTEGSGDSGGFTVDYEPGDMINQFKIIGVLGEGGMGIVYLAEQSKPVRRRVALKVIKAGMDTKQVIARFEAERQALAMMNHPGIAQVYEAGATEQGRPYFVLEYIKGMPITEGCDEHKLDMKQRLKLFMKVCDAVQHAHMKGIIHRDLKPSNILVAIGDNDTLEPKVIDFGVAKATGQQLTQKTLLTQVGRFIGTPAYMSPEQADLKATDIDTRTDVYSLGVILYEMLTGSPPFDPQTLRDASFEKMREIICTHQPPKPSTHLSSIDADIATKIAEARQMKIDSLSGQLRKELEWIPLKALRKRRSERYDSPKGMGDDVLRYLKKEPLEAGPESDLYRFMKTVYRHKVSIVTSTIVLFALIASTIIAFYGWSKALESEEKDKIIDSQAVESAAKDVRFEVLERAYELLTKEAAPLNIATPEVPLTDTLTVITSREAVPIASVLRVKGNAPGTVITSTGDAITVDNVSVGTANLNSNNTIGASIAQQQALEMIPDLYRPTIQELIENYLPISSRLEKLDKARYKKLIETLSKQGQVLASQQGELMSLVFQDKLGELLVEKLSPFLDDMGELMEWFVENVETDDFSTESNQLLVGVLVALGREYGVIEEQFERLCAGSNSATSSVNWFAMSINARRRIGEYYYSQNRYSEMETEFRRLLNDSILLLGEEHEATIWKGDWLGSSLYKQKEYSDAETVFSKWLEISKNALGKSSPTTLALGKWLGRSLDAQKNYTEAEAVFKELLEISKGELGEDNATTIDYASWMAYSLYMQEKYVEAEEVYRKWLEISKESRGEDNLETIRLADWLGDTLRSQKKYNDADAVYREWLEISKESLGEKSESAMDLGNSLGKSLYYQKKYGEAETVFQEWLEISKESRGEDKLETIRLADWLRKSLNKQQKYIKAEAVNREYLEISKNALGEGHATTIDLAAKFIQTLTNQKRYGEAEAASRKWLEISKGSLKNEHAKTVFLASSLGYTLCLQENYEDAKTVFRQWLDVSRKSFGEEHYLTIDLSSAIGWALNGQTKYSEAEKILVPCYKISNSEDLSEYYKTTSAWWLGEALFWQGKYARAEEPLIYSFNNSSDIRIGGESIQPKVARLLIELYVAMDKPEEAQKYRDILEEQKTDDPE